MFIESSGSLCDLSLSTAQLELDVASIVVSEIHGRVFRFLKVKNSELKLSNWKTIVEQFEKRFWKSLEDSQRFLAQDSEANGFDEKVVSFEGDWIQLENFEF